ncbi:phospholipase D-like domain-containing protein [Paraburkholderia dinghuensis]|uniref:Phospholipase n=1 Tax=Paraburkholderia dinghuensis TaxID=2305225 RepID=A0A3N6NBK5_9BURK|nr:phospholipase D-like domain-containing protein [Paraburkholderia dinghuensis]RQH05777.1 phospholipase [Paraburkholderia dinghuensis]
MADTLQSQNPATVAIDEQTRTAQGSVQWLLEKRQDIAPITYENTLDFMICGEDGFRSIANDLKNAKSTVEIICWGFDPGMELVRGGGDTWPRGQTYGALLEEITTRKENPVTVRLMIWYADTASAKQNNVPGYSDNGHNPFTKPAAWVVGTSSSPYDSTKRQEYCIQWWKDNLPKGNVSGKNPRLQVAFRSVETADAKHALADEEDKPVYVAGNLADETGLLQNYPTHHQKPILIDYAYEGGRYAVGYVMGLNSVTDYWDTTAHNIDDPIREALAQGTLKNEQAHEEATQGQPATKGYVHGRPYQDYACRVVGPALKRLHHNFVSDWNIFAPDHKVNELTDIPANIPKVPKNPAHGVQIVRTHPREKDKTIKELYYQASSFARNYIYIENQYFFYPAFARHLKDTRQTFCEAWAAKSGKPVSQMPMLHLFIVIPHPEDDGMIPRTYDMLTELGSSDGMSAQRKFVDDGDISQNYPDAKTITDTVKTAEGQFTTERKVLDRPSAQQLAATTGMKVSVARLRASGPHGDGMAYREIYIHSKLMIIDDVFLTVGSANLNQRSMSSDSEINIGVTGLEYAGSLRQNVFKLHSGGDIPGTCDLAELPQTFNNWTATMKSNLVIQMKGIEKMQGFLLPFEDHRSTTTMHASIDVPSSTGSLA